MMSKRTNTFRDKSKLQPYLDADRLFTYKKILYSAKDMHHPR